jgi:hypothetical protein
MKNMKYIVLAVFIAVFTSLLSIGCGDDPVTNNNNGGGGGGYHPTINFLVGQTMIYSNDSILPAGGHVWTGVRSTDLVQAQTTVDGKLCYPVFSTNFDSSNSQTTNTTYFVAYTQSEGIFYQYGLSTIINPSQTPTWDPVGNFDAARGSTYNVSTVNYTANITGLGTVTFTGPLTGKVADSTTITTTGPIPRVVPCYKIELNAQVSGTVSGQPVSANINVDYYIGYGSPTGIVQINLKPFSFTVSGIPNIAPQPGYDHKLYNYSP